MMSFLVSFGCLMLVGLLVAHAVGYYLTRLLEVEPGHIREVMPTIPVAPLYEGDEQRRWKEEVREVEKELVERFSGGVSGVTAAGLAGEMNRDERVVSGALERMREEVDCRLRITRSGQILHDFGADAIERLQRERTRLIPTQLLMLGMAATANIGAVWPILAVLFLALASLGLMATYEQGTAFGLFGLGSIAIILVGTIALSLLWRVLSSPFIGLKSEPTLGPMTQSEPAPQRRLSGSTNQFWAFFDFGGGGGWGGGSGGDGADVDGDDLGEALIALVLIAIVVLCLITLFVWLRGLWRAVVHRDEHLDRISPAFWVRAADRADMFEKWMPTNDLVGRLYRAIERTYAHRRPVDADLGPRTLARAKRRGGVVSALEIAMEEGLDLSEAMEVGAELCRIVEGEVVVGEGGEVGFAFSDEVLRQIDETAGLRDPDVHAPMKHDASDDRYPDPERMDHLWSEYLDLFEPGFDHIARRPSQPFDTLPINLVGVGWGHLQAAQRLVAGTWLMAGMGTYLLLWGAPETFSAYLYGSDFMLVELFGAFPYVTALLLVAMALGTSCLATSARYIARQRAIHGVRRDARRAAFDAIHGALQKGQTSVDLSGLTEAVLESFQPAWSDCPRELVEREIKAALADLEVGFDLEAPPNKATDVRDLDPLLERWTNAVRGDAFETVLGRTVERRASFDDEEVVFDTEVEHDHAMALF